MTAGVVNTAWALYKNRTSISQMSSEKSEISMVLGDGGGLDYGVDRGSRDV